MSRSNWFSFNMMGLSVVPPHAVGVYGLRNSRGIVYIGKGELRSRLLSHLRGDNPEITKHRPTEFTFEFNPDPDDRERWLISYYMPPANKQFRKA